MKIGIFNWRDATHPQAGGAEAYIVEQAKIWAQQGHEIAFFCSAYPNAIKDEVVDGIHYVRRGGRFSVYSKAFWLYPAFRNVDIIIDCNNGIPFFTPLYSRKKKILLIYHISGNMWYKEMPKILAWLGKFLETKFMPLVYRGVKVVTISPSSRKQCKDIGLSSAEIVYPGINPWYSSGDKSEYPEIVYIGRLKKYKSVDTMLKAVAKVDTHLKVNIIGTGDDEPRLRNMVISLGLKNVNFLGFVDEAEKTRLLQRAWMAINPSQIEGWSISNLEASACGTLILASDVNGNKDSVIDNETGLLFGYNNVERLAEEIQFLLKNEWARYKYSHNARIWAGNFSWNKSANKFLGIIKREVDKK